MSIEALKTMKEQLMSCVQGQLGNLQKVDAKQLGEAIDMIKDLSQAIYYCTITQAMEKSEKEPQAIRNVNYYTTNKMYPDYYRDMERDNGYMYYPSGRTGGKMYYSGSGNSGNMGGGSSSSYYTPMVSDSMAMEPMEMGRDPREGRAALRRKMYMEGKEKKHDTNSQLKELEAYLQELSTDVTEMIKDASPEERATLHQKMTMLANKIA